MFLKKITLSIGLLLAAAFSNLLSSGLIYWINTWVMGPWKDHPVYWTILQDSLTLISPMVIFFLLIFGWYVIWSQKLR